MIKLFVKCSYNLQLLTHLTSFYSDFNNISILNIEIITDSLCVLFNAIFTASHVQICPAFFLTNHNYHELYKTLISMKNVIFFTIC